MTDTLFLLEREPMSHGIQIPLYQVDAFTDKVFSGNPAAVCLLEEPLSTEMMQAVAAEMNLSETAFVQPPNSEGTRKLQWFTPEVEVPLCGHATLATSHVLIREREAEHPLLFDTLSGLLTVSEDGDGWLRMDFPEDPPKPATPPEGLLEALNCPTQTPTLLGKKGWVLRLPSEEHVRTMRPDFSRLEKVAVGATALGVIVTAPGEGEADFVSRFFGPWVGVDEDPVTGMAHTLLTPYWASELGVASLRAEQLSQRGGELRVRLVGNRVHVFGKAVTVSRGTLNLP
jgi:PhzF family phenazine biosynthesis protein